MGYSPWGRKESDRTEQTLTFYHKITLRSFMSQNRVKQITVPPWTSQGVKCFFNLPPCHKNTKHWKAFSLSPLLMLALGFSSMPFIRLRNFPSMDVKSCQMPFLCWDIVSPNMLVNTLNHIDWSLTVKWMFVPEINSIWSWCIIPFTLVLDVFAWNFVKNFHINIHEDHWILSFL